VRAWRRLSNEQAGDQLDEPRSVPDRLVRFGGTHVRIDPNGVVGDRFKIIGLREECWKSAIDLRISLRESREFAPYAAMRFRNLPGASGDKSLRSVVGREIRGASRRFRQPNIRYRTRFF